MHVKSLGVAGKGGAILIGFLHFFFNTDYPVLNNLLCN